MEKLFLILQHAAGIESSLDNKKFVKTITWPSVLVR
jgi:hypothetical protein